MRHIQIALLILAATVAIVAQAQAQDGRARASNPAPISALRDKKWWVGEAVILGTLAADGQSTCRAFGQGYHESNPILQNTSRCRNVALFVAGAAVAQTVAHLLVHRYSQRIDGKWWHLQGYVAIPAVVVAIHGSAAIHNYTLPSAADLAAARARLQ